MYILYRRLILNFPQSIKFKCKNSSIREFNVDWCLFNYGYSPEARLYFGNRTVKYLYDIDYMIVVEK